MLKAFHFPRIWLGAWVLGLVASVVICLVPLPRLAASMDHLDKLEHALGYALLAGWAAMLFATLRGLMFAAVGLIAWGIGIEGLQALVPWRSASLADVVANGVGVAVGSMVFATRGANALQWLDARLSPRA